MSDSHRASWIMASWTICYQGQLSLPSPSPGDGKWVPALAGKAKAGMVHSVSGLTRSVQVKLWDPLRTRAIPVRFRGVITTRCYTNPRLPYLTLPLLWYYRPQLPHSCSMTMCELPITMVIPHFYPFGARYRSYHGIRYHVTHFYQGFVQTVLWMLCKQNDRFQKFWMICLILCLLMNILSLFVLWE